MLAAVGKKRALFPGTLSGAPEHLVNRHCGLRACGGWGGAGVRLGVEMCVRSQVDVDPRGWVCLLHDSTCLADTNTHTHTHTTQLEAYK